MIVKSIFDVHSTPENATLYGVVNEDDPDVRALAESIRQYGVREPLVITKDGMVLSGHRRLAAAHLVDLTELPCRVEPIEYSRTPQDEIMRLLREHNRQRVKTLDELLREEVVSADPRRAYQRILNRRTQLSDKSRSTDSQIELSSRKERSEITNPKLGMLYAVTEIIENRRKFWPLSVRQVHYCLLNDPPLRNSRRPDSVYVNDRVSYGDLCNLLTRARLANLIPWEAIGDETRPTTQWRCFSNMQDFVRGELDGLFDNYARDLQRTQPNHIEIIGEKLTVQRIVELVAGRYCIPVTIGRGYCSITPRYEIAQRFTASGKHACAILALSDFDPDGENIAESFARSLRDDFGIRDLIPIKVALTEKQIDSLNLQPQMQAKAGSSQYGKFTEKHGTNVFELEAVEPETLQEMLIEAIESVMDLDAYESECEAEETDAGFLETARLRACRALAGITENELSD